MNEQTVKNNAESTEAAKLKRDSVFRALWLLSFVLAEIASENSFQHKKGETFFEFAVTHAPQNGRSE
jgi:hypothetical protein